MATILHSKYVTYYVIIVLGAVIAIASYIYSNYIHLTEAPSYNIGFAIIELTGLYLLYSSGTFKKTRFARIARAGISIVILGTLFKILHLTGSNYVFIIGFVVILACYFMAFLKKAIKNTLDWLKLTYVCISIISYVSTVFHYIWSDYLPAPALIMLIAVAMHIYHQKQLGYPEDNNDNFSL